MIKLKKEDRANVINNHRLIDEVFHEMRKDVAQSYYVVEAVAGEWWDDDRGGFSLVPDHLLGFWRTAGAADLRHVGVAEALRDHEWVRCEKVASTAYTWEPKVR